MGFWERWNFKADPFNTLPLDYSQEGSDLLIGRDKEIQELIDRLQMSTRAVTIEGPVGVGKTSLINVALYRCYREFFRNGSPPFFVPCRRSFQLTSNYDPVAFESYVLMAVAQTLLEEQARTDSPKIRGSTDLDQWLNHPLNTQMRWSLKAGPFGVEFGKGPVNNTSGFATSGLREMVREWLGLRFPSDKDGAVVCVIDNLELLQTSRDAVRVLEDIRDTLLTLPGLRWVLCGSRGIVRSIVSTSRLERCLHQPIVLTGISDVLAQQILSARVDVFAESPYNYYLPINGSDFAHLFRLFNANPSYTLKYVGEYCLFAAQALPFTVEEKSRTYAAWLWAEATKSMTDIARMSSRSWRLLEKVIRANSEFAAADYAHLGYTTADLLRADVKPLTESTLLEWSVDETDKRRKIFTITPKALLVNFARCGIPKIEPTLGDEA
jgi:hypothetical protein